MKGIKIKDMYFAEAYMQMFDLLDDCILVIDKDEEIVYLNKASEQLDKIKREEVIGHKFRDIYKVNVHSSSTLKCLDTKETVQDVYQDYITKRGDNIITISSSYPLIKDGEIHGVFSVTKDITKYEELMKIFRRAYNKSDKNGKYSDNRAIYNFNDIIGRNVDLVKSIDQARIAARTKANILIYGETGTGKELYAQSIHNESGFGGRFVSINCAAIPENLLESILFGTVEGAYTGAINKSGLFEEADNGTLFLDELNSMSPDLQAKILRAIETGKIRRVGENKEINVNVRIISTSNVHPFKAIENGCIRRDLYYRLGVVTIKIPPLRERKDDIRVLTEFFIEKFNKKYDKKVVGVSDKVAEIFNNFNWQGNVRELQHNIEQSMIMIGDKEIIEVEDLPIFIREWTMEKIDKARDNDRYFSGPIGDIDTYLENIEKEIIDKELEKQGKNVSKAAESLGLSRQTLDYRIKKHGIST